MTETGNPISKQGTKREWTSQSPFGTRENELTLSSIHRGNMPIPHLHDTQIQKNPD